MRNSKNPIGVFDSGIGGITVLKHLMRKLPNESFIYLGDTARVPYGNKSAETVKQYASQCATFLLQHDVRMIVIACNTASALALTFLQESVSVPVVGVIEPAALIAAATTKNGHIGVIGTRATVASDSYAIEIGRVARSTEKVVHVHSRPCPLFVPLVEEGWLNAPASALIAEEYLRPLKSIGIDTLVLGCTHYPLLSTLIGEQLPGVQLIDCGECAAQVVVNMVGDNGASSHESSPKQLLSLYVTDNSPAFSRLAAQFLGMPIDEPVLVSIDSLIQKQGV